MSGFGGPLVEPGWLAEHLADPDLRIVDATVQVRLKPLPRMRSGKREWKRATRRGRHSPTCAGSPSRAGPLGRSRCRARAGSQQECGGSASVTAPAS